MKHKYFQGFEDKYIFSLSRVFWHFFITIGIVVIVFGLGFFIYTVIPTSKKEVLKNQPPAEIQISIYDIKDQMPQQAPTATKTEAATTRTTEVVKETATPEVQSNDPERKRFDQLIAQLKVLIPPFKYTWEGSGYFSYPFGKDYWDVYQKEEYRVWEKTGGGVLDDLNNTFSNAKAYSYSNKSHLLASYISILKLMKENVRLNWLKRLEQVPGDFSTNANINNNLTVLMSKVKGEDLSYLEQLIANNNNENEIVIIDYINSNIDKFEAPQRSEVVKYLEYKFRTEFAKDINKFTYVTAGFLPLINSFKGERITSILNYYYKAYKAKNNERDAAIAAIEEKYSAEILQSEIEYNQANGIKEKYRLKSIIAVGSAVAVISVLAILLVFLSIQRSVRRLEEKAVNAQ
jgi:hypothetical protein